MAEKYSNNIFTSSRSEREMLSWVQILFNLLVLLPVIIFFIRFSQPVSHMTGPILIFLLVVLLKFVMEMNLTHRLGPAHILLMTTYPVVLTLAVFQGQVLEIILYLGYLLAIVDGLYYYGIAGAVSLAVWQGLCYTFSSYFYSQLLFPSRYFASLVMIYYLVALTTLFCLRELSLRRQKHAEEDLLIAETINQMKISINHELGNPLAGIFGNVRILKENEKNLDPQCRQALEAINHESGKMKLILEDMDNLTAPIIEEYLPGMKMINIRKSADKPKPS